MTLLTALSIVSGRVGTEAVPDEELREFFKDGWERPIRDEVREIAEMVVAEAIEGRASKQTQTSGE